jgi:hypothetical protein
MPGGDAASVPATSTLRYGARIVPIARTQNAPIVKASEVNLDLALLIVSRPGFYQCCLTVTMFAKRKMTVIATAIHVHAPHHLPLARDQFEALAVGAARETIFKAPYQIIAGTNFLDLG